MKYRLLITFLLTYFFTLSFSFATTVPIVSGSPKIVGPNILMWPHDNGGGAPNLTERTSNTVLDLHARINNCDMVLTTSGNYHMALRDLWFDFYIPAMKLAGYPLRTWYYTTSPPIATEQILKKRVTVGNVRGRCRPQVAVGPRAVMDELKAAGLTASEPVAIIRNRGNVLLVKAGNPLNIQSIWDLGKTGVRVATSHPTRESGSFGNYSGSIFNIALNDSSAASGKAEALFNSIFNSTVADKWVTGRRIHHREVPWLIARNRADVAPMFYHLAIFAKLTFPHLFDIVPLGGTVDMPEPLTGNKVGTLFAVKIAGSWSNRQLEGQNILMRKFQSTNFSLILEKYGIDRPY